MYVEKAAENDVCMKNSYVKTLKTLTTELHCSNSGMSNSFGVAGHIRDKLGIRGPVHVLYG